MSEVNKQLIIITGPTGVGKTSISIRLAQHLETVILSADSRQFYKEMSIGTAVPTKEELRSIKHFFIQNISIYDDFNVSKYEQEALSLLALLFKSYNKIILCGGSGLYIDSLCNGIAPLPNPDIDLRKKLNKIFIDKGISYLQNQLINLDPEYYSNVDIHNPNRLIRAIEVCIITGQKYSELRKHDNVERFFDIKYIALNRERNELYSIINKRTDAMIEQGFEEEARKLHPFKHLNALNTVGYKELFAYFENEYNLNEAIDKIKVNTRRYAKRQLTWLKANHNYRWFHPDNYELIKKHIDE